MNGYIRRLLDAQPTDGDDTKYKTIVVVFPDLPADRAQGVFDERPAAACSSIVCGRWNPVRALLRGQRGDRDIQLELPAIHIARAVSVREAWGHQRLEVLPGQRGLAHLVGASLRRIRSPRPRRGTTTLAVARGTRNARGCRSGRAALERRRTSTPARSCLCEKRSSEADAVALHATERCARRRPIDRRAAACPGKAVVSGEPGRTLARDDCRACGSIARRLLPCSGNARVGGASRPTSAGCPQQVHEQARLPESRGSLALRRTGRGPPAPGSARRGAAPTRPRAPEVSTQNMSPVGLTSGGRAYRPEDSAASRSNCSRRAGKKVDRGVTDPISSTDSL